MDQTIKYDRWGRMQYHPEFHAKHKQPWTTTDQAFLIENYEAMGPEQVSLALERTIHTVYQRVCYLRRTGVMAKATVHQKHRREMRNRQAAG